MRDDVRPRVPTQHEEHQDKDQPQEVGGDPADTLVSVVALENGFEAECHVNILWVTGECESSLKHGWINLKTAE